MPGSSLVLQHSSHTRLNSSLVQPSLRLLSLATLASLLILFRVLASVPGAAPALSGYTIDNEDMVKRTDLREDISDSSEPSGPGRAEVEAVGEVGASAEGRDKEEER